MEEEKAQRELDALLESDLFPLPTVADLGFLPSTASQSERISTTVFPETPSRTSTLLGHEVLFRSFKELVHACCPDILELYTYWRT